MANYDTLYSFEIDELSAKQIALLGELANDANVFDYEFDAVKGTCRFYSSDAGEFNDLTDMLIRFSLYYDKPITLSYANTCSRPLLDSFGGGGVVIYKGKSRWLPEKSLSQVAEEMMKENDNAL